MRAPFVLPVEHHRILLASVVVGLAACSSPPVQSVSTNSDNPDLRWTLSDAGPDTSVDTTVPVDATPTEDTTTSEDVPATCESTCDGADTWCEGDEVVECVRGADGCFHEERGECTGCEMVGGDSVCVIRTTCVPTCGIESRYCSAGAVNECAPDEDGCLQFTVSECAEGEVCSEADGAEPKLRGGGRKHLRQPVCGRPRPC